MIVIKLSWAAIQHHHLQISGVGWQRNITINIDPPIDYLLRLYIPRSGR
jgi:hypothetical protein